MCVFVCCKNTHCISPIPFQKHYPYVEMTLVQQLTLLQNVTVDFVCGRLMCYTLYDKIVYLSITTEKEPPEKGKHTKR